jgi:predicted nucleic acid-binding protein
MVLEAAINGRADCIVTFNAGHFTPASRFGVEIITPAELMRRIRP